MDSRFGSDVPLDVLDAGREPDPRRRAVLAALLLVVLAVGAAGWYLDHRSREQEFTAVSRCAQQATSAYRDGTAQLAAMAEYVRPSLVYAPGPTAGELLGMVARQAEGTDAGLRAARGRCAGIDVRRWHSSQRAALSAQLAFQDAQLALLARIAQQGSAYYEDQDDVAVLGAAAASALAGARP